MKKTIIILFVLVLMASLAIAAGPQGIHEPGTGLEQPELMNASQGTGQGAEPTLISAPVQQRLRARNYSELQLMVQERNQEMAQEMQQLSRKEQAVYQNQNKVRLAVHALLASENLTGGIGPQISAIAIQFNNSVQATIRAEERIQNRSAIARFFAGGDAEDAAEIEQQVVANRARIQQLNQLREQCPCDEQVRATIQEQIQNMEQEQTRLQNLAQKEKQSKGIFGWIWK